MTDGLVLALLEATPGWAEQAARAGLDRDDAARILAEAERFAEGVLAPLGAHADAVGCRLVGGRVRTPDGYGETYARLGADGWLAPDLPPGLGGQGLPLALHAAASLHFEAAAMPFLMAATASRAAAHLLVAAAPDLAALWVPKLASGEWTATICISEPDAGSDLGRIRTRAAPRGEGWRIDGTKCWISFGDHDMTARIGHLVLARTGAPEESTRGLSLFLVPDRGEDGAANGITVERIEAKLGLHGSPTCALRFEAAEGTLIGAPGRGLPALFRMIGLMRLQVGCQGASIALRSAALARRYAGERRQGGDPQGPSVPIARHADVARQLTMLDARAMLLAALALEAAVALDVAHAGDTAAGALASFLLPLAKTFGGELGFAAASGAIQVLGGAGYTCDWPAERYLRDARILTIYEGTTGMQAQDFLIRRLVRDRAAGLEAFLARARAELGASGEAPVVRLLGRFEALSRALSTRDPDALAAAADGYLRAGWCAVAAVLAARLRRLGGAPEAAGRHWLATSDARMGLAEAMIG